MIQKLKDKNLYKVVSVAEATKMSEQSVADILHAWSILRHRGEAALARLHMMERREVVDAIEHFLPFLLSWQEIEAMQGGLWVNRKGSHLCSHFMGLAYNNVKESTEDLISLIKFRSEKPPPFFKTCDNIHLQLGWEWRSVELWSAPCVIDLSNAKYGAVRKIEKNVLHGKDIFSAERGLLLLKAQRNTMVDLADLVLDIASGARNCSIPREVLNEPIPQTFFRGCRLGKDTSGLIIRDLGRAKKRAKADLNGMFQDPDHFVEEVRDVRSVLAHGDCHLSEKQLIEDALALTARSRFDTVLSTALLEWEHPAPKDAHSINAASTTAISLDAQEALEETCIRIADAAVLAVLQHYTFGKLWDAWLVPITRKPASLERPEREV